MRNTRATTCDGRRRRRWRQTHTPRMLLSSPTQGHQQDGTPTRSRGAAGDGLALCSPLASPMPSRAYWTSYLHSGGPQHTTGRASAASGASFLGFPASLNGPRIVMGAGRRVQGHPFSCATKKQTPHAPRHAPCGHERIANVCRYGATRVNSLIRSCRHYLS